MRKYYISSLYSTSATGVGLMARQTAGRSATHLNPKGKRARGSRVLSHFCVHEMKLTNSSCRSGDCMAYYFCFRYLQHCMVLQWSMVSTIPCKQHTSKSFCRGLAAISSSAACAAAFICFGRSAGTCMSGEQEVHKTRQREEP
jgi:hypothetical protein